MGFFEFAGICFAVLALLIVLLEMVLSVTCPRLFASVNDSKPIKVLTTSAVISISAATVSVFIGAFITKLFC